MKCQNGHTSPEHNIEYSIHPWGFCYTGAFLRRSLEVAKTGETFEEVLHRSPGFANPSLIEYLTEKLGISESNPPSLMRSLQM